MFFLSSGKHEIEILNSEFADTNACQKLFAVRCIYYWFDLLKYANNHERLSLAKLPYNSLGVWLVSVTARRRPRSYVVQFRVITQEVGNAK